MITIYTRWFKFNDSVGHYKERPSMYTVMDTVMGPELLKWSTHVPRFWSLQNPCNTPVKRSAFLYEHFPYKEAQCSTMCCKHSANSSSTLWTIEVVIVFVSNVVSTNHRWPVWAYPCVQTILTARLSRVGSRMCRTWADTEHTLRHSHTTCTNKWWATLL